MILKLRTNGRLGTGENSARGETAATNISLKRLLVSWPNTEPNLRTIWWSAARRVPGVQIPLSPATSQCEPPVRFHARLRVCHRYGRDHASFPAGEPVQRWRFGRGTGRRVRCGERYFFLKFGASKSVRLIVRIELSPGIQLMSCAYSAIRSWVVVLFSCPMAPARASYSNHAEPVQRAQRTHHGAGGGGTKGIVR